MDVDDDVEDDDMDFNPLLREGSPSETSSSLTSDAECEETSFDNQPSTEENLRHNPDDENTSAFVPKQEQVSDKSACEEHLPESAASTQLCCENGEGHVDGLGKGPLQTEAPSAQSSHPLSLEASEEDAICRRTRARYSLADYALEELETFLQESDDDGDPQNVNEEEEYRKFLAAVLSGGGDDAQACQGDETHDEDENDADFELEIEEALESDGDEIVDNNENINGRSGKDGRRPQTRKKRPASSRAANCRQETKPKLRPLLPNMRPGVLAPVNACGRQYPSQNIMVPSSLPSSLTGASAVYGFTDGQLGQLHTLIYEHVQLMIQTFSLCVLEPSKQHVAADVKKMIVELVGCRDQALARTNTIRHQFRFEPQHLQSALSSASPESLQCQWVPPVNNPVMSILDVSPLHFALSYLSDAAAAVVKYRRSHVDGPADKARPRKEPLFPLPVLSTGEDANNVSQDGSNNVSTTSQASPGPKKSLAAALVESTKKESVALVPFDIARLAERFYPLFNFSLFPRNPPPAAMVNRFLFTEAEDGLLALGILEYNNDWGAIQKRFLPCKSTHQIFVRQKNRSSSSAPDNPIKDVRRMKTSPLSAEEIKRIEEGLKIFKIDWPSIWKFLLPYRDPALLKRQWRVAIGVQRSYSKSDAVKEKRRLYEAKRRKLRAPMPDSREVGAQEAEDDASEGVENDDDSYVNEAFLADTENMSVNMMQTGTSADDECGAAHGCVEQHNRNSMKHGVSTSYTPIAFRCTLDERQASQMGKEKGSHVVKLAPDLPALNLPPSVRVISQREFRQNAAHFSGTSDNAAKDRLLLPPPTFTESVHTQLNLFPNHNTSDRLQKHGASNGSAIEEGAEQDFPMHPLLFQHPREVHSSYSHPVENLNSHSRSYDLFPFEKVQVEKSNKQTTDPVNTNTIDFHPLLQRTEAEMEPRVDNQLTVRESSTSPCGRENSIDLLAFANLCERESNIDLDIHLSSSMDFRTKEFRSTISEYNIQPEGSLIASISNIEPINAYHREVGEPSEEVLRGIIMEQEELTDSEEDIQHVEFECEEMDDSEEEQVQDAVPCSTKNKVVKQGASRTHKSHGSSSQRSGRAKLRPERGRRTGSRPGQRSSTSRTSEPSPARIRRTKGHQKGAGVEHKSSNSRRSRKSPAPS